MIPKESYIPNNMLRPGDQMIFCKAGKELLVRPVAGVEGTILFFSITTGPWNTESGILNGQLITEIYLPQVGEKYEVKCHNCINPGGCSFSFNFEKPQDGLGVNNQV